MSTTITRDDARTCFYCSVNPPVFRVISLERFPDDIGNLVPDTLVGLFCESCLRLEIESYYDAFEQAKLPLGMDESPNGFLCRQIGFAVVPLIFGNEEATVMIDELSSDWLECAVN
jgi:hypothetical protein